MASKTLSPPKQLRLLLDQGFPNPPGFDLSNIDRHVTAQHLSHWRPDLFRSRTPDWVLYCEASLAGFNALVTRDFMQAEQPEGMVCLDRLKDFHVVSWRERVDDPIVEWGQILAFLPEIRRYIGDRTSKVIFLPRPRLAHDRNVHDPKEFIGHIAAGRGESAQQVRDGAGEQMLDWERHFGANDGRYARLLQYAGRKERM